MTTSEEVIFGQIADHMKENFPNVFTDDLIWGIIARTTPYINVTIYANNFYRLNINTVLFTEYYKNKLNRAINYTLKMERWLLLYLTKLKIENSTITSVNIFS